MSDKSKEFNTGILVMSELKKNRKGDGINAVLKLLADVRDFQDKIEVAIEAQGMVENKVKLEECCTKVEEMYETLLEIASGGIRSIKNNGKEVKETEVSSPVMVNTPVIPKM